MDFFRKFQSKKWRLKELMAGFSQSPNFLARDILFVGSAVGVFFRGKLAGCGSNGNINVDGFMFSKTTLGGFAFTRSFQKFVLEDPYYDSESKHGGLCNL